jgi:hypothetical protein
METKNRNASDSSNEFGLLYVATGARFIKEAIASAESAREHMPSIPIALFTDQSCEAGMFDYIEKVESPEYYVTDKIRPLRSTPFQKTLFLDTDTIVCRDFSEIFTLLDRFELAAVPDVRGGWYPSECNRVFPEFNTGVIAYRKTEAVLDTFRNWEAIYESQLNSDIQPPHDQPSFRDAVYRSPVQFVMLPFEYNLRTIFPMIVSKQIQPAILHGRNVKPKDIKYFLLCPDEPRVILPKFNCLYNGQMGVLGRTGKFFTNVIMGLKKLLGKALGFQKPKTTRLRVNE